MEAPIPTFDPAYEMPISKDVSQALAELYGYRCQLSDADVSGGGFHVDHVYPRVLGGPDNLENYVIAGGSANSAKSGRRLAASDEARLLAMAKANANAPALLARLTGLRAESGGKAANPIVVYAFRLIGAQVGTRVATGSYLRALDGPAPGVMWWGYFGPDRKSGAHHDLLQFGVKVLGSGVIHEEAIRAVPGIRERGGSTYYFPVKSKLPLSVDRNELLTAKAKLSVACGR